MLIYRTINNDWNNWYIELYELYPCNTKEELCRKEGNIIRLIGTLNSEIAGRTKQEYHENNKEKFNKISKIYYEKHKQQILEQKKEYHKENKEERNEKQREYYKENKEEILTKQQDILICECGCYITKRHKARHEKTKKHINALQNKNISI